MGFVRTRRTQGSAFVGPLAQCAAVVAVLLTGCASQHGTTTTERARATHQSITLRSPAVFSTGIISGKFHCAERIWLPLSWNHLPPNTAELVVYIGGYGPEQITAKGTIVSPIIAGAIIAGLKPDIHSLKPGALPAGAIGVAARRIPVCPPRAHGGQFIIRVYALSYGHKVSRATLTSESPLQLLENITEKAAGIGSLSARYG